MAKSHSNPESIHRPHNDAYSHVVVVESGRLAFLSGQVAFDREGRVLGGDDVGQQARHAYRNLRSAIEALGATTADIVKLTTFEVGDAHRLLPAVGAARDEILALDGPMPASTLVGVTSLATPDLLIEVEAVVLLD